MSKPDYLPKIYENIQDLKDEGKTEYTVAVQPDDVKAIMADLRENGYEVNLMKQQGIKILSVTW